ncbi:MAG: Zn-dependent alcohol dehydrogenase [Dehalococcoidia bacterium]|nr:MAG: Zn-dependent alcohol dehydrogenase [Dehalococcoidia bacterium]
MRAAVLRGPDPMTIEEVNLDGPRAGEVRVKVLACGVCHSDLHTINRAKGGALPVPVILGHEVGGIVEEVGSGVTSVKAGDHVVVAFRPNCGQCFFCLRGDGQLCERPDFPERAATGASPRLTQEGKPILQGIGVAGYSEYTVMPERGVVKVRDDAPLETICLVGCGVTTGVGAAIRTAKVEAGSTVAVIGLGGVGLNVVQGARLAGAKRIIAIDTVDSKADLAAKFGATHFVNAAKEDAVVAAQKAAGGYIDYAFEAIGLGATVTQAFNMVRAGGTAVVVGVVGQDVTIPGLAFLREKRLIGSFFGSATLQHDIPLYVDMYMDGKLNLDDLVSRRRPLAEVNEAFEDMKTGGVARSVMML